MSDFAIQLTEDGADLALSKTDIELSGGLFNSVYLSLFTDGYWWGNALNDSESELDSDIPRILREEMLTQATANDVQVEAARVLNWLKSNGVASSVTIETEIVGTSRLNISVDIQRNTGSESMRFALNWDDQTVGVTA